MFRVYQDSRGAWRWELRARNKVVIAKAPTGYPTKHECLSALESVRANVGDAEVVDLTR